MDTIVQPENLDIWSSNPHLKKLLVVLIFVFLFSGVALAVLQVLGQDYRDQIYSDAVANWPIHRVKKVVFDGRLEVDSPKEGSAIGQTFIISGKAQGWFEGTIGIEVQNEDGKLLYKGNTIAQDNYEQPAPFQTQITLTAAPTTETGKILFNDYSAKDGSLVYQKIVDIKFAN